MIEFLLRFQVSIFAMVMMIALVISIYQKSEIYSYSNRLLKAIALNMILILFLEIMSWAFEGIDNQTAYIFNYSFNFLLILLSPGIPAFWASYIDYKIHKDKERIRKRLVYMHGFILGIFLIIINFFEPILFSVSKENIYQREPLLWVNLMVIYLLLAHSFFSVIRNRKKVNLKLLSMVSLMLVLPSIAALIQMLNYGLVLMWPTLTIVVVITYLLLETQSPSKDYLTGLFNRSRLDDFVDRLIEREESFSLLMIDLDYYKEINDTYGHTVGDEVIIMFSNMLKSNCNEASLVSRYGGDEFVVVTPLTDNDRILDKKSGIKNYISSSNDEIFSNIKFSYGYSTRTKLHQKSYKQMLIEADKMMYEDKAENKNYKRRKDDR